MDVASFGAKGDYRTDDSAALQAALNQISRNGGRLDFPVGGYIVTKPLTCPNPVLLAGVRGLDGTGTRILATVDGTAVTLSGNGSVIQDIEIVRPSGPTPGTVGVAASGWFTQLRGARVQGFDIGARLLRGFYTVAGCNIRKFDTAGIEVNCKEPDAGDASIGGGTTIERFNPTVGGAGIWWRSGGGMRVSDVKINGERTLGDAILYQPLDTVSTSVFIVNGCSIENFAGTGIRVDDPAGRVSGLMAVTGNEFAAYVTGAKPIVFDSLMQAVAVTGNTAWTKQPFITANTGTRYTQTGNAVMPG